MSQRFSKVGLAISIAAAVTIGLLTLRPGPRNLPTLPPLCLICSSAGLADAILNVALFVPLGFGLKLLLQRGMKSVLLGAALSMAVELAQIVVPGRDASLGDLITNTTGTLLGVGLAHSWRVWLTPTPIQAARLRVTWAVAVAGLLLLVPVLLGAALPRSVWWGQWTPELGHLDHYRGRVLEARIDTTPLPSRQLPAGVRERLLAGDVVAVTFIAGPPPAGLAPIFSIYDDEQREMLLLGARGRDLVLRHRTRANTLRLDAAELRLPDVLADVRPGDTARVTVRWQHPEFPVTVDSVRYTPRHTLANGPSLLLYAQRILPGRSTAVQALCAAALFFPLGFWTHRRPRNYLPGLACVLLFMGLPILAPIAPLPWEALGAPLLGLVAGVLARVTSTSGADS